MDYMAQNGDATDGRKLVKWSPPYRGERVDYPVFDLVDLEKDGPVGRIVLNSPDKRNPLG
jgi:hypothetical protein